MNKLELTHTEAFYLHDFVQKEWFKFLDTIVDKKNMSDLDKEIYKTLKDLADKLYKLRIE